MTNSGFCSTVNVDVQTITVDTRVQTLPEIKVTAGIQGPPGSVLIDGKGFEMENLRDNDLLSYARGKWRNTPQTAITDGGNF